jgi:hypothetical protein
MFASTLAADQSLGISGSQREQLNREEKLREKGPGYNEGGPKHSLENGQNVH